MAAAAAADIGDLALFNNRWSVRTNTTNAFSIVPKNVLVMPKLRYPNKRTFCGGDDKVLGVVLRRTFWRKVTELPDDDPIKIGILASSLDPNDPRHVAPLSDDERNENDVGVPGDANFSHGFKYNELGRNCFSKAKYVGKRNAEEAMAAAPPAPPPAPPQPPQPPGGVAGGVGDGQPPAPPMGGDNMDTDDEGSIGGGFGGASNPSSGRQTPHDDSTNSAKDAEITELTGNLNRCNIDLEDAQHRIEQLEAQLTAGATAATGVAMEELKRQVQQLTDENNVLSGQANNANAAANAIASMRAENDQLKAKLLDQTEQLRTKDGSILTLKSQVATMRDLEVAKNSFGLENDRLRQDITTLQGRITELSTTCTINSRKITDADVRLQELDDVKAELEREMDKNVDLNQELVRFKTEAIQLRGVVEERNLEIATLKANIARDLETVQESNRLIQRSAQQQGTIDELRGQVQNLKGNLASTRAANENLNQQLGACLAREKMTRKDNRTSRDDDDEEDDANSTDSEYGSRSKRRPMYRTYRATQQPAATAPAPALAPVPLLAPVELPELPPSPPPAPAPPAPPAPVVAPIPEPYAPGERRSARGRIPNTTIFNNDYVTDKK